MFKYGSDLNTTQEEIFKRLKKIYLFNNNCKG